MIADVLDFVRRELRAYLGVADAEVIVNSARTLVDQGNPPGAYISVVNIQEETSLRNQPNVERRGGIAHYVEPPVHLTLDLLFAFEFQTYATSLVHLSKTIELFQLKRWFGPTTQTGLNAVPFPPTLEKLVLEMVNMNFEELNHLWGVLGGAYFPSVVYRVRLVKVQASTSGPAPEITTIRLETQLQ